MGLLVIAGPRPVKRQVPRAHGFRVEPALDSLTFTFVQVHKAPVGLRIQVLGFAFVSALVLCESCSILTAVAWMFFILYLSCRHLVHRWHDRPNLKDALAVARLVFQILAWLVLFTDMVGAAAHAS
jgi:hypothetical protein